jgi:cyclopropane fatty-acyl-phospholipid synthase-like methyltransferase
VDLSTRALRLARQKTKQAGVAAALFSADLCKDMKLPGTFDLALDIGCFHGVSSRRQYLDNLISMLGRGGHWLMYGFLRTGSLQFGLDEADLTAIGSHSLKIVRRIDGFERLVRPSAWFLFEKVSDPS